VRAITRTGGAVALVLIAATLVAIPGQADARVVLCRHRQRIRLRQAICKRREIQIDARELGVTGPDGPQGVPGTPGAPGAAGWLAYAHVMADGTLDATSSRNLSASNITHPAPGIFCFSGLGFSPHNAIVTLDPGSTLALDEIATPWAALGLIGCNDPATQLSVVITQSGQGFKDRSYFLLLN
jgi:hypothetical protein